MLHEFTVTMPLSQVDEAIEKLNFSGYYNLYYDQPIEQFTEENGYGFTEIEDASVDLKIFLEPHEAEADRIEAIRKQIAAILGAERTGVVYQWLETENWQQPFPVIDLENGWYIQPTHSDEKAPAHAKIIHFEPPRAFGSGLHQTTQDCLRLILNEDMSGKRLLDLGTGAGLLSIAAALAGAESIVAVDIEDIEAEVLYNAGLNGVEERFTVIQGDALDANVKIEGTFDWILINIAANEVKALQPFVEKHIISGGKVILSGMVEWNYKEALELYEAKGCSIEQVLHSDEWVTALAARK